MEPTAQGKTDTSDSLDLVAFPVEKSLWSQLWLIDALGGIRKHAWPCVSHSTVHLNRSKHMCAQRSVFYI